MRLLAVTLIVCALSGCRSGEPPATSGAASPVGALDPDCVPAAFNEFQAGEPQSGAAEEVAGAAFARSPLGPGGRVERLGIDRNETLRVRYVRDGKTIGLATMVGGEDAWSVAEMTVCAAPPVSR